MMAVKKIEPEDWASFFGDIAKDHRDRRQVDYAEVRVISRDIGVQKEISWLPLIGITYDGRNDVIDLSVENMNHLIQHPREVYAAQANGNRVSSLEVLRKDGTVEIIEIR